MAESISNVLVAPLAEGMAQMMISDFPNHITEATSASTMTDLVASNDAVVDGEEGIESGQNKNTVLARIPSETLDSQAAHATASAAVQPTSVIGEASIEDQRVPGTIGPPHNPANEIHPFNLLPTELRTIIYGEISPGPRIYALELFERTFDNKPSEYSYEIKSLAPVSVLLRINQETRNEALKDYVLISANSPRSTSDGEELKERFFYMDFKRDTFFIRDGDFGSLRSPYITEWPIGLPTWDWTIRLQKLAIEQPPKALKSFLPALREINVLADFWGYPDYWEWITVCPLWRQGILDLMKNPGQLQLVEVNNNTPVLCQTLGIFYDRQREYSDDKLLELKLVRFAI